MAGIGFELRRLIETRTIGGFAAAAISGSALVAGPWLISAASVAALQALPFLSDPIASASFTGAMVWAFAISIVATTGPLYIFVRLSADLIYEHREAEAADLLLRVAAALAAVSLPIGYAIGAVLAPQIPDIGLFRLSFSALFASVNVLWAAMMTATALKRPFAVLGSYAAGMAALYALGRVLGPSYGAAGAVASLAVGYAITASAVIVAVVLEKRPKKLSGSLALLVSYQKRYGNLAIAGFLYALGTWCDKFFLWAEKGSAPFGTLFFSYPAYDTSFFYASLSLIPGLVFFTIVTEIDLHLDLSRFVVFIGRRRFPDLDAARLRLMASTRRSMLAQSLFQFATACVAALVFPALGAAGSPVIFLLGASCFQLLLLTAVNVLFYLELYKDGRNVCAVFVGVDVLASLVSRYWIPLPDGFTYLAACIIGSALGTALAFRGLSMADRLLYIRASGDNYGR